MPRVLLERQEADERNVSPGVNWSPEGEQLRCVISLLTYVLDMHINKRFVLSFHPRAAGGGRMRASFENLITSLSF